MSEHVALSKSHPLIARSFDYKHFTYPWHFHPEFEIIYIKEGKGQRFIGNSADVFGDGDIVLIGSNLPHYMKSDPIYFEETDLRVKGTIIQFEKGFMMESITHYPHFAKVKSLLEESQKGIWFPPSTTGKAKTLLDEIPKTHGMAQIIMFLNLLHELADSTNAVTLSVLDVTPDQIHYSSKIEKILSYLNKRYTLNVSLNEIASHAAMNPTAFCRFFKAKTGKSFKIYLLDMRIEFACKLLISDSSDISNISGTSGFESISHFNRSFKRKTGVTPSDYRKMFLMSG